MFTLTYATYIITTNQTILTEYINFYLYINKTITQFLLYTFFCVKMEKKHKHILSITQVKYVEKKSRVLMIM